MTSLYHRAQLLSSSLFQAWHALDRELALPEEVMRQIESLRPTSPVTESVRKYFQEICFERLLLGGTVWSRGARKNLSGEARSEYLDWLMGQEFPAMGSWVDAEKIVDPAYSRWASLRYANSGTPERSTWTDFLERARGVARHDCEELMAAVPHLLQFPEAKTPGTVADIIKWCMAYCELDANFVRLPAGDFGYQIPLIIPGSFVECRVRDARRISVGTFQFEFEVNSSGGDGVLKLKGDSAVWPGCSEYMTVARDPRLIPGLCLVLAQFAKALLESTRRTVGTQ